MAQAILKKVRQQAVVSCVGSGTETIDLAELALPDETFDRANSKVTIAHIYFNFVAAGSITRGSDTVLSVGAGALDNWNLAQDAGFVLNQSANTNVVVNFGASAGTVYLVLHKSAGYAEPDNQALTLANKW